MTCSAGQAAAARFDDGRLEEVRVIEASDAVPWEDASGEVRSSQPYMLMPDSADTTTA